MKDIFILFFPPSNPNFQTQIPVNPKIKNLIYTVTLIVSEASTDLWVMIYVVKNFTN